MLSEGDKQLPILKALNSPSSRSFFFTALIGRGSTNLFFKFLNSLGRNAEMS
jgi:hypothetical protein